MIYEERLIYKIVWLYYMDNMTQQDIAKKLNITRMKVLKLIEKAKEEKIIQFKIRSEGSSRMDLEEKIMNTYNLKDIFVVPTSSTDKNENIAKAAAQYIESRISENCYINIGYGDTVSKTINNLNFPSNKSVSLVALSGGMSFYTSSLAISNQNNISKSLPKIYLIPSPLILSNPSLTREILQERSIREIMDMAKLACMTIIGIGGVNENATIFKHNMISKNDLILLELKNAVGDILSQFYDKNGNKIDCDLHNRLISIPLDMLNDMNNVIAVACGDDKLNSIKAALSKGYIDILITDEDTAKNL